MVHHTLTSSILCQRCVALFHCHYGHNCIRDNSFPSGVHRCHIQDQDGIVYGILLQAVKKNFVYW